jgi:MFS family permease
MKHRNLYLLFSARFLSTVAIQMQSVAIGWQIYELTKKPLDLGLVGLAQFFPIFGLSLIAGQAADRLNRKHILIGCYLLGMFCSIALCIESARNTLSPSLIYGLLVLVGISRAFIGASAQALLTDLVSASFFPRAVAMSTSNWQIAVISGPALGGLIYGAYKNPAVVYGSCAVFFVLAMISMALISIRTTRADQEPVNWRSFFAGLNFVFTQRILVGALSLDLFAVLLGGAVALLPIYASDILQVGPAGLGLLRSAPSVGAALTGILLAFYPLQERVGPKMLACVLGFGVMTIAFGLSRSFALSLVCLTLMGALDLVSVVIRHSLVQLKTPAHMRGRVSAVNHVFIGASNELGEFESGVTAAWFGAIPAVIIGGIGTCIVTLIWSHLFPELRQLNRFSELKGVAPEGA